MSLQLMTPIAISCNLITSLLFSLSKWIIDYGTTNHMLGNSTIFSLFKTYTLVANFTSANESTIHVFRSNIIHLIPSLSFSSVMSLPNE